MGWFDKFFGPPSPGAFAKAFIREVAAAGSTEPLRFEPAEFRLVGSGATPRIINLQNMYAEYCATPAAERPAVLRRFAQAAALPHSPDFQLPEEWSEARSSIRPKLWPRSMLAKTLLAAESQAPGGKGFDMPEYELGSHLVASLVYDLPHAMMSLNSERLAAWNVSVYEALEAARENLAETPCTVARLEGVKAYASATGDNYDSSRILLLDMIRSLEVEGRHVALVPNRDTLLVTGEDDEAGLAALFEIAADLLANQPRPMTPFPLVLVDDDWEDWHPPAQSRAAQLLAQMAIPYWHAEYGEQKPLLEKLYERELRDWFVASYVAVREAKSQILDSYCVWSEGLTSVLPLAGRVALVRAGEGEMAALVPWAAVQKLAGNLLEALPEVYPPRFLVREFPSPELLERLKRLSPGR